MASAAGHRVIKTRRGLAMMLVAVLAFSVMPWAPAGASEPGDGELADERAEIRDEPDWAPDVQGMALWFWPEGRRVFQVDVSGTNQGLVAYDAATLEELGRTGLKDIWGGNHLGEFTSGNGRHHIAAVDREHGRVFVPYKTTVLNGFTPTPYNAEHGGVGCAVPVGAGFDGCLSGIHVIDGETMEPLGRIPLEPPTLEGPRAMAAVKALEYAPADEQMGWGGRVVMIVEEIAHGVLEQSPCPSLLAACMNTVPRRSQGNISYAVGFDPDGMRQEWAVRLEGCRNAREPKGWMKASEGHPATIFRVGGPDPALYVGCHGNSSQQGVVLRIALNGDGVPATLPVRVGDPVSEADPERQDAGLSEIAAPAPRQEVFPGPENVVAILSDPVSQRLLFRVDDSGQVWWVFDGRSNQWLGTIGIGDYHHGHTTYGLDQATGRLYVLAAEPREQGLVSSGGLYVADTRRTPLPQALVYEHLADPVRDGTGLNTANQTEAGRTMSVMPRDGHGVTRIFVTKSPKNGNSFRVLSDAGAISVDPAADDGAAVRTLDLDEAAGITAATFDGTARGFGFRTILLGGVEGAARVGPADPVGVARGIPQLDGSSTVGQYKAGPGPTGDLLRKVLPPPDPCTDAQRELIVAFVGPESPATVDGTGARGSAQPVLADVRTRQDAEQPVSRCGQTQWQELWRSALISQPPVGEPGVPWPFEDARSSCTATTDAEQDSWNDPVVGAFSSQVECSENQVGGWGQARGVGLEGVSVANTLSSFRIYRDPQRGLVARVESIARGVNIGGIVKIDTIRGVAESWANGRHGPAAHDPALERDLGLVGAEDPPGESDSRAGGSGDSQGDSPAEEDEASNPFNCDSARPAGTCFQRHLFGVTVTNPGSGEVVHRCGPCGDEDALLEAMNRAFGAYGHARFREPDPALARGSDDGYIAAVVRPDRERFADIVMNADLLETMVPMLEVVRYAPHNRPAQAENSPQYTLGTPPRGRQLYQFAAVEVSSTYSIQCLLNYDAVANVCAAPTQAPASLQVELVDGEDGPLSGGAFELRTDGDGDGVLGLADELVPEGACITAEDGIGTCRFDGLEPGSYLVSQVTAPPGYASTAEPFAVSLSPGDIQTVTFTNTSNLSVINLAVTDSDGAPLPGATFGVFPDAGDGTIAPDAPPVATCTTDATGSCSVDVEPGAYVLRQLDSPAGFAPIGDIPFEITSGGQTADVGLMLAAAGTQPEPVTGPPAGAQPVAAVIDVQPGPAITSPTLSPGHAGDQGFGINVPQVAERVGDTIVRVIRAPAALMRLASRSPIEAASFAAVWALLALAALAVRRRMTLAALVAAPAGLAHRGAGPTTPTPPGPGGSVPPPSSSGPSGPAPSHGGPFPAPSPHDTSSHAAPAHSPSPAGGPDLAAFSGPRAGSGGTAVLERPPSDTPGVLNQQPTEPAREFHRPGRRTGGVVNRPPVVAGAAPSPTERGTVRVIVATAFPALAALLTQKLAAADRCELVGAVDSLDGIRAALAEHDVDVLVADLALPAEGSPDLVETLAELHPPERTVGLIPPSEAVETLVVRGHHARLAGLLVAEDDLGNGHLAYVVRQVGAGKRCYGPTVHTLLVDQLLDPQPTKPQPPYLTERELEIARMAARGLRRDIARTLVISDNTVRVHLQRARKKLDLQGDRDHRALRRRLEYFGLFEDDDESSP